LALQTLDKKVLSHSLYNYIAVVGVRERDAGSVNVRPRQNSKEEKAEETEMSMNDFINMLNTSEKELK